MQYIKVANIPKNKVTSVIVDYRTDATIVKALHQQNIEVYKTVKCKDLYDAINGHPDILLHHIGDNKIIVSPNIFDNVSDIFIKKGFALTKGETWLCRNYPGNIAYNVLRMNMIAFHNTKYTDRKIMEEYEKINVKIIHVNQGYTKCSGCIVNESSLITSDKQLAIKAENYNIDCLLIEPGGILLPGLDYGFIGGSAGLIDTNLLALTGSFSNLKDKKRIIDFLNKKGAEVKILNNKQIIDIGSIIPLTC